MNLCLLLALAQSAASCGRRHNLYYTLVAAPALVLSVITPIHLPSAQAIPIPDATLGAENSQVDAITPNIDSIHGGALRGNSLFHSFLEFNIDENRGVFFFSPAGVENIFSRVTGAGSPSNPNTSNILGVLGTFGGSNPNLYLLNPNGILFGPNSRLAVTGSFFATTADEVQFGDQGIFSTLTASLPSGLLTVSPSAFLFNQTKPGDIVSQSNTFVGITPGGFSILGLRVPDGENLTLLGGNVTIDGGNPVLNNTAVLSGVTARNGRVEIGAVGGIGLVEIGSDGGLLVDYNTPRADITLIDRAIINNVSSGVGNIALTARNINLASQSFLLTGIESGAIASESQSGGIQLNASENIRISEQSNINSIVGGTGNGGEIEIKAGSLFVTGGGQIATTVIGNGASGNIVIDVEDLVILEGKTQDGQVLSGILSTVEAGGRGTGGSITLTARSLEATGGGQIAVGTRGNGNSGNIVLNIAEEGFFDGSGTITETGTQSLSGVFNNVAPGATGNGGLIQINAGALEFINGAQISAGTFGTGNASDVMLKIDGAVIFRGINNSGLLALSGILAAVVDDAVGNGGNIQVRAAALEISDGARIVSSATGQGNAGNIALIISGLVTIEGLSLIEDPISQQITEYRSIVASSTGVGTIGSGGDIDVSAISLTMRDRAVLSTSTEGIGNAGRILIRVDEAVFLSNGVVIFSGVESSANGTGGDIVLRARSFEASNGVRIDTSTSGRGNAGSLLLEVSELARFNNVSGMFSGVAEGGEGNGGNIQVEAGSFELINGSQIATSTLGNGNAGNLNFRIGDALIVAGGASFFDSTRGSRIINSALSSTVQPSAVGDAGDINVLANSITVLDGAQLVSSTLGEGDSGNINLNIIGLAIFDGFNVINENIFQSSAFTSVEEGAIGDGGNIFIEAESLRLTNRGALNARSLGNGLAGNITVLLRDALEASNGLITTASAFSSGGQISIEADRVMLEDDSNIVSQVLLGQGRGGDISLVANAILAFGDSDILAFAQDGQGGNITLNTRAFFGENYQPAPPGTDPLTLDGNGRVDINASGTISGVVTIPDVSFIENSLTALPDTVVETDQLIAGSCIARTDTGGSFIVSGRGGLPDRPSDTFTAPYSTGSVRPLSADGSTIVEENSVAGWQPGDPIVEPEGLFQLPDGRLVISQRCAAE